jgi:hypothetical protein
MGGGVGLELCSPWSGFLFFLSAFGRGCWLVRCFVHDPFLQCSLCGSKWPGPIYSTGGYTRELTTSCLHWKTWLPSCGSPPRKRGNVSPRPGRHRWEFIKGTLTSCQGAFLVFTGEAGGGRRARTFLGLISPLGASVAQLRSFSLLPSAFCLPSAAGVQ